jgi:hypothetical protein
MALAALVVAIVSSLIGAGALLHNIRSFRRTGWDLKVIAWWDQHDKQVHVRIINVGRQACVVSQIKYHITDLAPKPESPWALFYEQVFRDPVSEPIAPSDRVEVMKALDPLPDKFTLEVGVVTGDRTYMSEKSTESRYSQFESWMRAGNPDAENPDWR